MFFSFFFLLLNFASENFWPFQQHTQQTRIKPGRTTDEIKIHEFMVTICFLFNTFPMLCVFKKAKEQRTVTNVLKELPKNQFRPHSFISLGR